MNRSGKFLAILILMCTFCTQISITFGQATILISSGSSVAVNDGDMFYDAGGAAGVDGNTNYTITLTPAVTGESICLDFTMFNTYYNVNTEVGDSVCLFDGTNTSANKIATLMGNYGAQWNNGTVPTPVGIGAGSGLASAFAPGIFCTTNSAGSITISFYNTNSTTSPGWVARVATYKPLGSPGCNINLTANPNPACTGQSVTLTAIGDIVNAAIDNNFNGSSVGTGWQSTSSATFQTNACSAPSLDGSVYLWMANATCPRTLTSNTMDVSTGGTVSFEYRQAAINGNASPCEAPDVNMSGSTPEGVFLQYSINSGTTWNTMKVMFPSDLGCSTCDSYNGIGYESKSWHKIVVPIPLAARTTTTQFRWDMPLCTSASTDNWGLDNVVIGSPKPMTITLKDVTNNAVLGTSTTSPYNFTVTPAATTTYMATISDGTTSCTSQVVVTVNPCGCVTPTAEAGTTQVITCSSTNATLNGAGSSTGANYTYNWSASGGGNIVSGTTTLNPVINQPGTYTLTVSNTIGGCTATDNVVITSNTTPPSASSGADQAICSGQSATLTATGGGTYAWSNSATSASTSVTPGSTNTYTVTVTSTTNGCTASDNMVVNVTAMPTANAGADQTICPAQSATLNASGGSNYVWNTGVNTSTITVSPVSTSTYTVTVSNGACSSIDNVVVNVAASISANAGADQTICPSQSATLTASGGSSYSWNTGGNTSSISVSPVSTATYTVTVSSGTCSATDNVIVNVAAAVTANAGADQTICPSHSATLTASGGSTYTWNTGANTASITITPASTTTYTVTVSNGTCSATDNVVVTIAAAVAANAGADQTICPSQSAILSASGGTSYAWSTGANTSSINVSPVATSTYTVTVTSGTCSATDNVIVNVAAAVTANAGADQTICPASSTTLTASGGTSYTWNTGASTASFTVTPASTTTYTVTVSNGTCSATDNVTVNIAAAVLANAGPDQTICPSSSATLNASGGSAYSWSTGANTASINVSPASTTIYTVTVSNGTCSATEAVIVNVSNNASILLTPSSPSICNGASVVLSASGVTTYNWSPASSLSSSSGISVTATPSLTTTYTVTGTNGIGCTGSASLTVNVAPIAAIASSTSESCGHSNGTVSVNASGPCTNGFTYLWNTPSQQTLQNVSGLAAGNYTVTVNCGTCTTTATTTVAFIAGPTVSCTGMSSSCGNANGSATANPSGGSGPYSYTWSCLPAQITQAMTNVQAGTFTVTVTDANSCSASGTVTISDIPGPSATATLISSDSCNRSNGSAIVNVAGGTAPYFYSWNSIPQQNNQTLNSVSAGTYTATVTDANGCIVTSDVTINSISGPLVVMSSTNETCGQGNGTATANASQGSGNYTYLWNTIPAQNTPTATNLVAGTYTVTVDDGICSVITSITLNNMEGPTADMIINPKVVNTLNGFVNFTSQSSGNIVSCNWDYGDGTYGSGNASQHDYQNIGTYIVTMTITDSYGCIVSVTDTVKVKDIFTLYIPNAFTPDNDGLNDQFYPLGLNIDPSSYEFEIYDRWGNVVFSTTDLDAKWNGTYFNKGTVPDDCIIGVYVYRIVAQEVQSRQVIYTGKVTLIR
jgi:gliding motility-associated-like protein